MTKLLRIRKITGKHSFKAIIVYSIHATKVFEDRDVLMYNVRNYIEALRIISHFVPAAQWNRKLIPRLRVIQKAFSGVNRENHYVGKI